MMTSGRAAAKAAVTASTSARSTGATGVPNNSPGDEPLQAATGEAAEDSCRNTYAPSFPVAPVSRIRMFAPFTAGGGHPQYQGTPVRSTPHEPDRLRPAPPDHRGRRG